jgi:HPt (histidine-containing phosphotransfer) domain-containing protein
MNIDPTSQTTIHERIRVLALRFLERCLSDTVSMRALATQIRGDVECAENTEEDIDLSPLRQLEHLAHKIHGTGASFGYAALSECGGAVERLAESLIQTETPLDMESCDALDSAIARLSNELNAIAGTQGLK